jgi:hypothetical protein
MWTAHLRGEMELRQGRSYKKTVLAEQERLDEKMILDEILLSKEITRYAVCGASNRALPHH